MRVPLPVETIRTCSRDARFVAAIRAVYDELDRELAARAPVCVNRGACCRFDSFGHSLFVTSAELAYFIARTPEGLLAPADRTFCPYQRGGACTSREGRPAGCRIYFCDPTAEDWQPSMTETVLRRLRAVGERFELPYAYVEWTDALRDLGGGIVPADAATAPASRTIDSTPADS